MLCGEKGICGRCMGGKHAVLGALVLLNIYAWPKWTNGWSGEGSWIAFFAVLLIAAGVFKFAMPTCPHCKAEVEKKSK